MGGQSFEGQISIIDTPHPTGNVAFYRLSDGQEVGATPVFAEEIAISATGDRLALIFRGQIQIWEIGS